MNTTRASDTGRSEGIEGLVALVVARAVAGAIRGPASVTL